MNTIVVSVSGGLTSFEALRRAAVKHGANKVDAIFADVGTVRDEQGRVVCGEDDDLHEFLDAIENLLGLKIHRLKHHKYKHIWEAFFGERFLGNHRVDVCSKFLKREVLDKWIEENAPDPIRVLGFSWLEKARAERFAAYFPTSWFPLTEPPYVTNEDISDYLQKLGIRRPSLYNEGWASHGNCGGLCVKGGLGQLYDCWLHRPWRFFFAADQEAKFQREISEDGIIFKRFGLPRTMHQFAKDFEAGYVPKTAQARSEGCGGQCMIPEQAEFEF